MDASSIGATDFDRTSVDHTQHQGNTERTRWKSPSNLNNVDNSFQFCLEKMKQGFTEMDIYFREKKPMVLTREHLETLVQKKFGLQMSKV